MAVDKPTTDWLMMQAENLRQFYRQRNQNMKAWRSLYYLDPKSYFIDSDDNFVPQADDETRIVLPIAHATVESFRSLLMARPPVIDVPASTTQEVQQEQAQSIEDMLYAVWSRANVNKALQDALWHALVDGWGVLQIRYDPAAEERGDVPIYVKNVDPLGVWPMPGDKPGEWAYVIAFHKELVGTLRHTFVESRDGRLATTKAAKDALSNFEDDDTVIVYDYWDDEFHGIMVAPSEITDTGEDINFISEGDWILPPTEHEYGRLPFVIWHGLSLPSKTVGSRMGVGVLWPIEGLVRYLSKLVSTKASIIARYADPTLVTRTMDGSGFPKPAMRGGHVALYPEEDASYLLPPGPMPQIDSMMEEMIGQTELAGLPRHIMGQITVGRISGTAMNLLRTPVLMRIAFKQMDMERALEDMNETILKIVENRITEPVFLWGHDPDGRPIDVQLDPLIINGYYRNEVRLSASLPTDEPATVSMLSALKQMNIISERTFRDIAQQVLRDMSPQSLENEEQQILIEQLVKMPPVQMSLMMEAAREADLNVLPFVEQMMGGQQGGQAGPQTGQSQPGFQQLGRESGFAGPPMPTGSAQGRQSNPMEMIRSLAQNVEGAQGGRPLGS